MSRRAIAFNVLGVVVLWLVAPGAPLAEAHWADLAVAEVVVAGQQAEVTLTLPTGLVAVADDNHNGQLSPDEVAAHRMELEALLATHIRLTDGATDGVLALRPTVLPSTNLTVPPGTHSTLQLTYTWPRPVRRLTMHYDLFLPGVPTASCLATIAWGDTVRSVVFTPEHRSASIAPLMAVWGPLIGFLSLGVRHILSGYDHMLFLISLVLASGGLRRLVKAISAFTVAHSLTLSLAAFHVVSLPSRWVESAIAASIVYVATRNLRPLGSTPLHSWVVTFLFGLVHGLGFASVLTQQGLTGANLISGLLGFNIGVEVGQLAIVTAAFTLLQAARQVRWLPMFRWWTSAGVALTGVGWLFQRAVLG